MLDLDRVPFAEVLDELDFAHLGGRAYRAPGCDLTIGPRWWVLRRPVASGVDWLERSGPWKLADARGLEEACDLPVAQLGLDSAALRDLLRWALAGPDGTDAPPPPVLDPADLTARAGTFVCQGVLQATQSRQRVAFDLGAPPAELPPWRRAWLDATCVATRRDRLVRVTAHPGSGAVRASFDLTGCPLDPREALLRCAVAHLRAVVERLLPVVRVLNDPRVASRALGSAALSPTAMEEDE